MSVKGPDNSTAAKRAFDAQKAYLSPDGRMVLFWQPPMAFSQWTHSEFTDEQGTAYTCAEQYMMAEKARLFGDEETRGLILSSGYNPRLHKQLGRQVKNFDQATWEARCVDMVVQGNLLKFRQNEAMLAELLATEDRVLVEASPLDKIWGIGLRADNRKAFDEQSWKGTNLLGKALMHVREILATSAIPQPASIAPRSE